MNMPATIRFAWLLALLMLGLHGPSIATDKGIEQLKAGGVLLLRHAIAPGFGDPEDFRVDDCSTQRNLSEAGRQQARDIGAWLRSRGIDRARVYSSQWCRCLETARLLDIGEVTPLPALNSFFELPENREPNLAALRRFLADQTTREVPLVLVTHQVTVNGVTGMFVNSGQGVVGTLAESGELRDASRLRFDE